MTENPEQATTAEEVQGSPVIDQEAIISGVAERIAAQMREGQAAEPQANDETPPPDEFDYDGRLSKAERENQELRQAVDRLSSAQSAFAQTDEIASKVLDCVPQAQRGQVTGVVARMVREIAVENPGLANSLTPESAQKIADMALGEAIRKAGVSAIPGGQMSTVEKLPHEDEIRAAIKAAGRPEPTKEDMEYYSKTWGRN